MESLNPFNKGLKDLKDKILNVASDLKDSINKKITNSKLHTKNKNFNFNNKQVKMTGITIALVGVLGFSIYNYNTKTKAVDVYLGQDKVGTVRTEEQAMEVLDKLKEELSNKYDLEVVLKKDISMESTHAKDELLTSNKQLRENLKSKMSFLVQGYVLEVEGEEAGIVGDVKDIKMALEEIERPYKESKDGEIIKEVEILEDINILKKEVPLFKIASKEDLVETLTSGSEEIKTHTVEVGESLWTIAKIYGTTVDELIEANSDKNPEKLQIGDEVKLVVAKSMLTVATVSEIEYVEQVGFQQEVELNDNMYNTEKEVKVAGENGINKISAKEIKHNGVLIDKEVLKEEVVKEPVNELVVRGTKEKPKTAATGAFIMPTRGRISSRYGMRNGRMHRGLDIAAKTGTPIVASDGGTVVYAGYNGAYGNMIEIDHGNGYRTRYAHCSKLLVGKGAKVYKGQHIANIGNTGRSSGPHVHLEVLKNGSNQNPSNYVK